MTIELKNEYLTVQFKTLGGQLTSIKDKDGIEYLRQADPIIGMDRRLFYFLSVVVYEMIGLFIDLKKAPFLQVLFVDMVLFEKKNLFWKKSMIIA